MSFTAAEQDRANDAFVARCFVWCRARLLHAMAGAAEQGVLRDVMTELLPVDGDEIHDRMVRAMQRRGWITRSCMLGRKSR